MKRILILLATLTLSAASAHGNEGKPVGQLRARDAHALLWLPDGRLLFGHHDGVQVSPDQGSTWKKLFDKPDFDAIDAEEKALDWDQRVFTDRQQSLTYVCETPVILEQRLFALGRALAAGLPPE